jgi:hypothetical protein
MLLGHQRTGPSEEEAAAARYFKNTGLVHDTI